MSRQRGFAAVCFSSMLAVIAVIDARAQYEWTPAQIQGLVDVTASFHGGAGQLSTINSITNIPGGIELDITYAVGQEADPFGPDYGLGFARVSLSGELGFPGLDASAFSSSSLNITTTTDITAQSFLQTDFTEDGGTIDDGDATPGESFSSLFWEHNDNVASGGPTVVDFDFAMGSEFDGNWNLSSPQQVQGTSAIRRWGIQLGKFSGVAIGEPIHATIQITSAVPEPTSGSLLGLGLWGLAATRRRRQQR